MYPLEPVGTGPFQFKEWVKNDRLTLERFEDYWGKKPEYKTLVIRSIPESVNRTIELENRSDRHRLQNPGFRCIPREGEQRTST